MLKRCWHRITKRVCFPYTSHVFCSTSNLCI